MGSEPPHRQRRPSDRFWKANGSRRSPRWSDIDPFRDAQSVFKLDAKIANGAVDLRVAEQELHRAKIPRLSIDLSRLGASQRMRAVAARLQTYRGHPVSDEARILPR